MFNIPRQITQGDRVEWTENLEEYDSTTDSLACFIRGQSILDLTGISAGTTAWTFTIPSVALTPGRYQAQFVIYPFGLGKNTLNIVNLTVCPSFESLSSLDTRFSEEIELEALSKAIVSLAGGVQEYYIGERRVRYADLPGLYQRQTYLKNRIAKLKNPSLIGGRNVGVRIVNE